MLLLSLVFVIISLVIPSSDIIQIAGISINSIFPLQGNFHFWDAKIMQIECRTTSLLDCYAEMQLILCKDTNNSVFLYIRGGKSFALQSFARIF